jgi:phosphoenolpyruvate-protein kinase (PTS system EI component)
LRPDKLAHYSYLSSSVTRPLDWRRVLESLPLQKLFKDQVRAILRAGAIGPVRMIIPLVTRTEVLNFVMETISQSRAELRGEGLEQASFVPLGIMLEAPAATTMIQDWAPHADFFALGTNDLFAAALGIDRQDSAWAGDGASLHPGFLRMLQAAIDAAHSAGRTVTVCGEMASDPQGAVALALLQVDSLSVAVPQLSSVRRVLTRFARRQESISAEHIIALRTSTEIQNVLRATTAP